MALVLVIFILTLDMSVNNICSLYFSARQCQFPVNRHKNVCYWTGPIGTYADAKNYCTSFNGFLMALDTEKTWQIVLSFMNTKE